MFFFTETGRRHCPLSQLVLVSSPGDRANQLLLLSWEEETNGCRILPIKGIAPIHTKITGFVVVVFCCRG